MTNPPPHGIIGQLPPAPCRGILSHPRKAVLPMRRLFRYLKGYEKETVIAPLFKMLEACF